MNWRRNAPVLCKLIQLLTIFPKAVCMKRVSEGRPRGRTAEAIPLLERTLADCERVLGPDHPNTLTSRNNPAMAYQDAGGPAEASHRVR